MDIVSCIPGLAGLIGIMNISIEHDRFALVGMCWLQGILGAPVVLNWTLPGLNTAGHTKRSTVLGIYFVYVPFTSDLYSTDEETDNHIDFIALEILQGPISSSPQKPRGTPLPSRAWLGRTRWRWVFRSSTPDIVTLRTGAKRTGVFWMMSTLTKKQWKVSRT